MTARDRTRSLILPATALALLVGWAFREVAFAHERAKLVESKTVALADVKMSPASFEGSRSGEIGVYLEGDTPSSTNFVTGRFVIDPGKTPHKPHVHAEEEVMVIESGSGEIFCDGKTTQVRAGSIMYTAPNVPHGIENTGSSPLAFTFIKWLPRTKN